jgi:hypothetical protein
MERVIADTGFVVALANRLDDRHADVAPIYAQLRSYSQAVEGYGLNQFSNTLPLTKPTHERRMGNYPKICYAGLRAVPGGNAQRIIRGRVVCVMAAGKSWKRESDC